jgi:hypothetical protein
MVDQLSSGEGGAGAGDSGGYAGSPIPWIGRQAIRILHPVPHLFVAVIV